MMKILIRAGILGFLSITLISFFFGPQVSQQAAMVNYQKEAEAMRNEQELKACKQFIEASFCTSPRDRYERYLGRITGYFAGRFFD